MNAIYNVCGDMRNKKKAIQSENQKQGDFLGNLK